MSVAEWVLLPCHVAHERRRDAPLPLASHYLLQAGVLALGSWDWDTWTGPSLCAAFGNVGPARHLGSRVELTFSGQQVSWPRGHKWQLSTPICHVVEWTRKRCPSSFLPLTTELVHPIIHTLYDLLEHVKGSTTQDNDRIYKRSPSEVPSMVEHKPEASNQTNDSLQWTLTSQDVWTKGSTVWLTVTLQLPWGD